MDSYMGFHMDFHMVILMFIKMFIYKIGILFLLGYIFLTTSTVESFRRIT